MTVRLSATETALRDRARLAALAAVADVLTVLGDDAPSRLVDAHRYLATGRTDEDAALTPLAALASRDTSPPASECPVCYDGIDPDANGYCGSCGWSPIGPERKERG